jgi:DUF438 domain-containing protein
MTFPLLPTAAGLAPALLDGLYSGTTLVDPDGRLIHYNQAAARYFDRKPEYIGVDIRSCHKNPESIARIDQWLAEFKAGREEMVVRLTNNRGRNWRMTFAPIRVDGVLVAALEVMELLDTEGEGDKT